MSAPSRNQILVGDARQQLEMLPNASVDCVVTSPPYFRLRDYDADGQLGLEPNVNAWVDGLQVVAQEVARVLVPTGSLWLNLGDTYSTHIRQGAPRKSLLMAPERVARALMADGWLLRNKIIWAKPNAVPTSVTDRLATTYEVIYVFARSPRYFFDLDAVRVPHRSHAPRARPKRPARPPTARELWRGPNSDGDQGLTALKARGLVGHPLGKNPGDVWTIATSTYRGAHFATYPVALAERMVRAGCPERRCAACRAPWRRPLRRLGATALRLTLRPTCACRAAGEPGLVLDPFMGAGTTALAAERLRRDWLGVELNPDFAALASDRITVDRTRRQSAPHSSTKQKGGHP